MKFAMCLWPLLAILAGCAAPSPKSTAEKPMPPAKIEGKKGTEADLASLVLTPEAEQRLGIKTAAVVVGAAPEYKDFAADLMLPVGRSLPVVAPVSGTLLAGPGPSLAVGSMVQSGQLLYSVSPLLPLPRDLRVTAEADLEQAKTRVDTANLRLARADKMLKDDVGTVRAQEDAKNELDLATSASNAARARLEQIQRAPLVADVSITITAPQAGVLRQVLSAPGQVIAGGAPLLEIADLRRLWVRTPVFAGEAHTLLTPSSVSVRSLAGQAIATAVAVQAPPTADPLASTVDLYFEIPNTNSRLHPGERVLVQLPVRQSTREFIQVPSAAVLFDIHGGAWVYEQKPDHRFLKRRIELDHSSGGIAFLRRGPEPRALVVTDGAAELWGTEFGVGK
ncbi:MAG: efflux RND transporter periplasmic adaptor subunit [Acidobacteria bacterium]|nr:efflux RND transporter periplasmic adaptor subunit [Acidobacteriota bacterium]